MDRSFSALPLTSNGFCQCYQDHSQGAKEYTWWTAKEYTWWTAKEYTWWTAKKYTWWTAKKVHVVLAQVDSQRCTTLTTLARSRPMMQPTIQVRESPFITRTVPVAVGTTIQPTKQGTRSPTASKVACITIIPKASK